MTAAARLQLARVPFVDLPDWAGDALEDWLGGLLAEETAPLDLGAVVAADLSQLTWTAEGPTSEVARRSQAWWGDILKVDGASAELIATASRLGAERAGTWITCGPAGMDTGWCVLGAVALDEALGLTDAVLAPAVATWAKHSGAGTATRLGRSLADGNRVWDIEVPLPGDTAEAQMEAFLRLAGELDVDPPSLDALAAVTTPEAGGLSAALALSATGLTKLGVVTERAGTRLLIAACRALELDSDESLAAVEGILSVEGPDRLEVHQRGAGLDARYRVSE